MTDYISREAAATYAESIRQYLNELYNDGWLEIPDVDWRVLMEIILSVGDIPAADVKPVVRGEWKKCGRDGRPLCSKCGYEPLEITREYIVDGKPHSWDCAYNMSNFCPNCGADMRKEANDDERNDFSRNC